MMWSKAEAERAKQPSRHRHSPARRPSVRLSCTGGGAAAFFSSLESSGLVMADPHRRNASLHAPRPDHFRVAGLGWEKEKEGWLG